MKNICQKYEDKLNKIKINKPIDKGTTIQFLIAQGKRNPEICKIHNAPKQMSPITEKDRSNWREKENHKSLKNI